MSRYERLSSMEDLTVQRDRSQAQDAYARIQQAIILRDEENRIREFVERIQALQEMDRSQVQAIVWRDRGEADSLAQIAMRFS